MIKEAAPELTASSSEAEEEKEEQPRVDGERDPDFIQVSQSPHWSCKWKNATTDIYLPVTVTVFIKSTPVLFLFFCLYCVSKLCNQLFISGGIFVCHTLKLQNQAGNLNNCIDMSVNIIASFVSVYSHYCLLDRRWCKAAEVEWQQRHVSSCNSCNKHNQTWWYQEKHKAQETQRRESTHRFSQSDAERTENTGENEAHTLTCFVRVLL